METETQSEQNVHPNIIEQINDPEKVAMRKEIDDLKKQLAEIRSQLEERGLINPLDQKKF